MGSGGGGGVIATTSTIHNPKITDQRTVSSGVCAKLVDPVPGAIVER